MNASSKAVIGSSSVDWTTAAARNRRCALGLCALQICGYLLGEDLRFAAIGLGRHRPRTAEPVEHAAYRRSVDACAADARDGQRLHVRGGRPELAQPSGEGRFVTRRQQGRRQDQIGDAITQRRERAGRRFGQDELRADAAADNGGQARCLVAVRFDSDDQRLRHSLSMNVTSTVAATTKMTIGA